MGKTCSPVWRTRMAVPGHAAQDSAPCLAAMLQLRWPNLNLTLRRSVTRTPLVHQGRHPRLCASASEQASHQQSS
eukprot:359792-Chlamydomonas_euryale.AAC.2